MNSTYTAHITKPHIQRSKGAWLVHAWVGPKYQWATGHTLISAWNAYMLKYVLKK